MYSATRSLLLIMVIGDTLCLKCGLGQCKDCAVRSPECSGKHGTIIVTGPMQQTAEGQRPLLDSLSV